MLRRIRQAQLQMDNACKTLNRNIKLMESCSTHTISIFRNAIRSSVPSGIQIVSGPGSAVCSTDDFFFDAVHNLAYRDDCIMTARAELLVVPHTQTGRTISELEHTTAVCCILDALEVARMNPNKTVIYAAVGFETCAPGAAAALEIATKERIENFCILNGLKRIAPALKKIASDINPSVDGFICCGNLVTITGVEIYDEIMTNYKKPCLSIGFEPMQLIEGIGELCRQIAEGVCEYKLKYTAANCNGNKIAQKYINDYFDIVDGRWNGLGLIEKSALALKDAYSNFDAIKRFNIPDYKPKQKSQCLCGEIICGLVEPPQCPLFGNRCTRKKPSGACMASAEGICHIWEKYSRRRKI